jgi:general secretion pathway protein B
MSYILDALKKSEAERNRHNPAAMLAHEPPRPTQPGWLLPAIAVLVALNLASLGGWWYWQQRAGTAAQPDTATTTATTIDTTIDMTGDSPAVLVREIPQPLPLAAAPPQPEPAPQAATGETVIRPGAQAASIEPATSEPVRLAALPNQVRDRLPALTFSTHIYADDPAFRRVVVNGERAVEGDPLGPGLWLQEITDTGVVVRFEGHLVRLDILQDWRS